MLNKVVAGLKIRGQEKLKCSLTSSLVIHPFGFGDSWLMSRRRRHRGQTRVGRGRKKVGESVPATLVAVEKEVVPATLVAVEHEEVPATLKQQIVELSALSDFAWGYIKKKSMGQPVFRNTQVPAIRHHEDTHWTFNRGGQKERHSSKTSMGTNIVEEITQPPQPYWSGSTRMPGFDIEWNWRKHGWRRWGDKIIAHYYD
ncbi:unnamed protein product, partial [Timema podura]|nr:unnamed protein product [Timema podura]